MNQLTAAKLACAHTQEMLRGGVTGVEFILGNAVLDEQGGLEASHFGPFDKFRTAHIEMPILAAGFTCELLNTDRLAATLQPVLAACASRNVQHLNMTVVPAENTLASPPLDYAEAAHMVYTALRDLRHSIESSGVLLNLEAGRHGLFLSPLEMRQILDAINSSAIGACVDLPHVSAFSRPADWIGTLGRRLKVLRVSEPDSALTQFDAVIIRHDE